MLNLAYRTNDYFNDRDYFLVDGCCFQYVAKAVFRRGEWYAVCEFPVEPKYKPWLKGRSEQYKKHFYKMSSVLTQNTNEILGAKVSLKEDKRWQGKVTGVTAGNRIKVKWKNGRHWLDAVPKAWWQCHLHQLKFE